MDKNILILNNEEKYITQILKWIKKEFAYEFGFYTKQELELYIKTSRVFIKLINNNIVGCVFLLLSDLPIRQDLTPWLGNLYVDKKYRGIGIAKELIEYLKKYLKNQKPKTQNFYLYTEIPKIYSKDKSMKIIDNCKYKDKNISIFICSL